ncbi:hypothetical protein B11Cv2_006490 [Bartonella sp. 1-1C]|nr:hypothetical protein B11Cv2_006490 [Bartonella sp. 1-1C]CBI80846.1 hypothetical protein B11C_110457 [Bartonella sp. 1-1C]
MNTAYTFLSIEKFMVSINAFQTFFYHDGGILKDY